MCFRRFYFCFSESNSNWASHHPTHPPTRNQNENFGIKCASSYTVSEKFQLYQFIFSKMRPEQYKNDRNIVLEDRVSILWLTWGTKPLIPFQPFRGPVAGQRHPYIWQFWNLFWIGLVSFTTIDMYWKSNKRCKLRAVIHWVFIKASKTIAIHSIEIIH